MPHDAALARLLEIRVVEVISGPGCSLTLSSVRCPMRRRSAAVEECACCGGSDGIARDALSRGAYLACRDRAAPARGTASALDTPVVYAMGRSAVAVRAGVGRSAAADALRARGVAAATVVDGDGRPIGAVTEADLLRARAGASVGDVMTRVALSVPESASIARAASLMAAHPVDPLPVVAEDGIVVGVLSASDVLAWLSGAGGPLAGADRRGD